MAQIRGFSEQLLFVKESVFRETPGTVSAVRLPFESSSVKSSQPLNESDTHTGTRHRTAPWLGNISVSGDVVVPLDARNIGYWLMLALGTPATTGAGPYTHTFSPGDTLPSAALESGFSVPSSHYSLFNGCKVNQLSLSFGGEQKLTATASIMGATETPGTTSMDDAPTDHIVERFANIQSSINEGGSQSAVITGLDITLANDMDGEPIIGSGGVVSDLVEGWCTVTGTVKALFTNQALYNKAINGTESSIEVTLTTGAHSLVLTLPEIRYERAGLERNGAKGVYVSLPFSAYYADAAGGTTIKAVLENDVASYG
jgi:hypothetical protein